MNAIPPEFVAVGVLPDTTTSLGAKWTGLHDAAQVVGVLAGVSGEALVAVDLPATLHQAGEGRLALAEQGLGDLIAVMEPGIAALLAVHARGVDPAPAAETLWDEFVTARTALIGLIAADGAQQA